MPTPGRTTPLPITEAPKSPVVNAKPQKWWRKYSAVILASMFFLGLITIAVSLIFLQRSQETRQQADQTPQLVLSTKSRQDGNRLVIDLLINTKGFPIAGTEIEGTLTGIPASDVGIQVSNTLPLEPVITRVVPITNPTGGEFNISLFAPLDPNRPVNTNNSDQIFASFVISNVPESGVTLSFNSASKAPAIGTNGTILILPAAQNFKMPGVGGTPASPNPNDKKGCDQNCATDTECHDAYQCYKGRCRVKGDLEDATCKKISDGGLNRKCNEYCADSRECAAGFSCYYNRCRNPRNVYNESCQTPASPRPVAQSSPTTTTTRVTPSPRASARPTPTIVATNVRVTSGTPTPTPSARTSPRPTASASASVTPRPSASPSAVASPITSPRVTPQPTVEEQPAGRSSLATLGIVIGALLILGVIGYLAYRWLNN
jgi:hypothetical protein